MKLLPMTGPAGVGRFTLCWEVSAQLQAATVAQAVIETDHATLVDRASEILRKVGGLPA
jgi:Ni2+-binding GTPase involved in maturation of urease and hydrogenase